MSDKHYRLGHLQRTTPCISLRDWRAMEIANGLIRDHGDKLFSPLTGHIQARTIAAVAYEVADAMEEMATRTETRVAQLVERGADAEAVGSTPTPVTNSTE